MRNDCRERQAVQVATIQGYHGDSEGQRRYGMNYAYRGFTGNWYFNSDRKEETRIDEAGNLVRKNGQPLAGYGTETEVECKGIRRQAVLAEVVEKIIMPRFKFGADMFKMQADGSLGGDTSVEIISQVMTKSRIRNDYAAYKAMYDDYFPAFGIKADSYTTACGMHVNVSNAIFGKDTETQWENVCKLAYIVNKHYSVFCKAFYRSPEKTRWCARMYEDFRTLRPEQASGSHGNCMNLSHFTEGRVEIRLVGGQKDYYSFRNTMETVFHLCERVSKLSWAACDDLYQIFKGCNQYVYKRLRTECSDLVPAETLARIAAEVEEENLELTRG